MVPQAISTVVDQIGTIAAAATDTNTIAVAAGEYAEVYGAVMTCGTASAAPNATGDGARFLVTVGSTVILGGHNSPSAAVPTMSEIALMFPPGTMYEGAPGEDIVVTVQNTNAATTGLSDVVTTLFYRIRSVVKGGTI